MTKDELRRRRKTGLFYRWPYSHIAKAGRGHKVVQLSGVVERTRSMYHGARLSTEVFPERIRNGAEIGRVRNCAPNRKGQPAARTQNSTHLPERPDTIGEELHALLT